MEKRVVCLGELMLRLKPPGCERFLQSPTFEARLGGSEANVAVSLARLGVDADYVTALPESPLGYAARNELRSHGVGVANIRMTEGRMGIYYLETGSNQRPSQVIYDRAGSTASLMRYGDFDWKSIFGGASHFHLSGITPAISESACAVAEEALGAAKAARIRTSFDINYRKKLWNYGKKAAEVVPRLVEHVDILLANEEDIQRGLGMDINEKPESEADFHKLLCEQVFARFKNLSMISVTMRSSHSVEHSDWRAYLATRKSFHISKNYEIRNIVDRVGAGDAFAAGLVYSVVHDYSESRALDFALAASAIKHSIPGDFNLATVEEVEALCAGDSSGRVKR